MLSRRAALSAVGGFSVWASGCNSLRGWSSPVPAQHLIDAHCHIFTGRDVPAWSFVLRVAAREHGFERYARLAAFFARILEFAPSAEDELKRDDHALVPPKGHAGLRAQIQTTLEDLQDAARFSNTETFENSKSAGELRKAGIPITPDVLRAGTYNVNPEMQALVTLRVDQLAPSGILPRLLSSPPSEDELVLEVQRDQKQKSLVGLSVLTQSIFTDILQALSGAPRTAVGRYLAAVGALLSYRSENLITLDRTFGLGDKPGSRLYCPAIIDYDKWLVDGTPASECLDNQVKVMASVARTAPDNVLVGSYIAFDPLRAVIAKIVNRPGDHSPLEIVANAIEHQGFAGAKLYPPMGFKPWNNKSETDLYGKSKVATHAIQNAFREANKNPPEQFDLGTKLDEALDEFYQYCLSEDVPIITHCGNSQTSYDGAGVWSDPIYWQQLLDRSGYENLRVNLGHFGGLWCASQDVSGNSDESKRCRVSLDQANATASGPGPKAWPRTVMAMLTATNADKKARYPNLYCDIADVITLDAPAIARLIKDSAADKNNTWRQRILYGTDWMFLLLEENAADFHAKVEAFARALDIPLDDIYWRNASRFLGLAPPGKTADRLGTFYANDQSRLAVLASFTDAPVPQRS